MKPIHTCKLSIRSRKDKYLTMSFVDDVKVNQGEWRAHFFFLIPMDDEPRVVVSRSNLSSVKKNRFYLNGYLNQNSLSKYHFGPINSLHANGKRIECVYAGVQYIGSI